MKKLSTVILSILMLASMSLSAFAADISSSGSSGQTPVTLTVAPARFSVTVPTNLPLSVDQEGSVTTASNAKIINNGHGSVKIINMTITPTGGWSIVGYADADMTKERVGSKQIALRVNSDQTKTDGTISFTASKFPALNGANTSASDELAITYDAMVPAQATALSSVTAATVVFTIAWNT